MNKKLTGALFLYLALAIALGAFGAHGLRDVLTEAQIQSYRTGVLYHLLITLPLLFLSGHWTELNRYTRSLFTVIWIGNIIFSFSIYGLSTIFREGSVRSILRPITPLGGLLMIAGFSLLGLNWIFRSK